jgi:hypothetical protein
VASERITFVRTARVRPAATQGAQVRLELVVALGGADLHPALEHAVTILAAVEGGDPAQACAAIAEIFEVERVDNDVARQSLPLEGLDDPFGGHDLAEFAAEGVLAIVGVLDEAPRAAGAEIHLVDDDPGVLATPPAGDVLGFGMHVEDELAREIEVAHELDFQIGGRADSELGLACHGGSP